MTRVLRPPRCWHSHAKPSPPRSFYGRCVQLRVVFLRDGSAHVVCDACLERVQKTNAEWAYCYLPRARDS